MRQRDVAALDAKYTKEQADAVLKNDALRDDVAAGRQSMHIAKVRQSCVKPPRPPAWIMQPSHPADTTERDYFTLRERLITMQKQLEGTQKYILSSCVESSGTTDGQLMQLLHNTHALPAEYKY